MMTWKPLITKMVLLFTTTCLCTNDLYKIDRVPLDLDNMLRADSYIYGKIV